MKEQTISFCADGTYGENGKTSAWSSQKKASNTKTVVNIQTPQIHPIRSDNNDKATTAPPPDAR